MLFAFNCDHLIDMALTRNDNAIAMWHSSLGGVIVIRLLRVLLLVFALSPLAAHAAAPVDINSADAAALEQVKGIGPSRAKAIVEYRQANGPFASVDDLVRVPGIGAKSVVQLRDRLTAGASARQTAKAK